MTPIQEARRICSKCSESKPETVRFFPPNKRGHRLGLLGICRICRQAQKKAWTNRNYDQMITKNRRWYIEVGRPRYQKMEEEKRRLRPHLAVAETIHHGMSQRVRRQGLALSPEFTVSFLETWLKAQPHCPCCGIEFEIRTKRIGIALRHSPSVDRFDSSRGYTLDNIELICMRCNGLKRDGTAAELARIAAWMEQRRPYWPEFEAVA